MTKTKPCFGLADNYRLTDGEINNVVYLTCRFTVDWSMRGCDLAVCRMLVGGEIVGDSGVLRLIEETCEYVWDHICGETDEFTPEQLIEHMIPPMVKFFTEHGVAYRSNCSSV